MTGRGYEAKFGACLIYVRNSVSDLKEKNEFGFSPAHSLWKEIATK